MNRKKTEKKVDNLIAKGDKFFKKGKYKKALKKYRKAEKYDLKKADLLEKLMHAHEKATEEWNEEDIVDSVGWLMQKQEIEVPSIKRLHKSLTPEWKEITEKIYLLLAAENGEEELAAIEKIKSYDTEAIDPLIDALLQIKKGLTESRKGAEEK